MTTLRWGRWRLGGGSLRPPRRTGRCRPRRRLGAGPGSAPARPGCRARWPGAGRWRSPRPLRRRRSPRPHGARRGSGTGATPGVARWAGPFRRGGRRPGPTTLHGQDRVPHRQRGQGGHQGLRGRRRPRRPARPRWPPPPAPGRPRAPQPPTPPPWPARCADVWPFGPATLCPGAHAPVVAQPGGHGGGPVGLPRPGVVEVAHRRAHPGREAVPQGEHMGQLGAVEGLSISSMPASKTSNTP